MDDSPAETRTIVALPRGARLGMVLSVLLLVLAGYLFWSPIQLAPTAGFPVMCGSAAAPPTDDLGKAACGDVNLIRLWQAGAVALAALVVAVGSVYTFGVVRRREALLGSVSPTASTTPSEEQAPEDQAAPAAQPSGAPAPQRSVETSAAPGATSDEVTGDPSR